MEGGPKASQSRASPQRHQRRLDRREGIVEQLQDQLGNLGSGVLSGAAFLVEAITGLVLALIVAFFILKDGDRVRQADTTRTEVAES